MGWMASRLLILGVLLAGVGFAGQETRSPTNPEAGAGVVGGHSIDPTLAHVVPGLPSFEVVRPSRDTHEKSTHAVGEVAAPQPDWRSLAIIHHDPARPLAPRTIHPLPRGPPVA